MMWYRFIILWFSSLKATLYLNITPLKSATQLELHMLELQNTLLSEHMRWLFSQIDYMCTLYV